MSNTNSETAKPRRKRTPRLRQPSARYMTLQQAADHYCVDESTIRKGLGVFDQLALIPTGRRTLVLRSSVERLDRELERKVLGSDQVVNIEERRLSRSA
jgi:hypothetical protein